MKFAAIGLTFSCAILGAADKSIESGFLDALGIAKSKVIEKVLPETTGARLYREGMKLRYSQPLDSDKAFKCFKQGYEAGNADCAYELSLCYLSGIGVRKSQATALAVLSKGQRMNEGSVVECEVQWINLHTGNIMELYVESKARLYAKRLVELSGHSTRAAVSVTKLLFSDGNPAVELISPAEHLRAVNLLKIKAAAGDPLASFEYGKILIGYRVFFQDPADPKYVKPDVEEGLRLIRYAASKELHGAHYQLYLYFSETDVKPITAYDWLEKAWAAGDCKAGQRLSYELIKGHGTAVDKKRSVEVALKVGEQGDADQTYNIADLFVGHTGFDKSLANFITWHRIAAEKGNAASEDQLGRVFAGEHLPGFETAYPVSVDEAFKYFTKGAYPEAGYNFVYRLNSLLYLGDMYRRGIGCPADPEKASQVYLDYLKEINKLYPEDEREFANGGKVRVIWLKTHYPNLPGLPELGHKRLRFNDLGDEIYSFQFFAKHDFDYELFDDIAKVISTRDAVEKEHFFKACYGVASRYGFKDGLFYIGDMKYGKDFNSNSYEWYKYAALSGSPSAAYRLHDMLFKQSSKPNTLNAGPEYALKLSMGRSTSELVIASGEGEAWRQFGGSLAKDFNDSTRAKKRDFIQIGGSGFDFFVQYDEATLDSQVYPVLRMINEAHRAQLAKNASER